MNFPITNGDFSSSFFVNVYKAGSVGAQTPQELVKDVGIIVLFIGWLTEKMGLRSRPIFRNRHFTFVFPPRNMTGMNHLAYQMHVQPGSATAYITNGMLLSSRALYLHAKRCFGTIHHTGDAQKSSLRSENQWFGDRGVQGLFWYTSCDGYLGLKGTIGTWVCLEIQKQLLSESFNCQTRRPIPILLGTPKSYILASISTPMISHYITMCVRLVRFVPIYATFFRPRQTYYQS